MTAHFDFLSFYTVSEFRIHYFKIVFSLDSKSFLFSPQSGLQWRGTGGWGRGFCSQAPRSLLFSPPWGLCCWSLWRCISGSVEGPRGLSPAQFLGTQIRPRFTPFSSLRLPRWCPLSFCIHLFRENPLAEGGGWDCSRSAALRRVPWPICYAC